MGFGYVFFGYLIAFLLSMTASALGFGSLALLLGLALMLMGLQKLCRYHRAFGLAKWLTLPLFILSLYWLLCDIDTMLLLALPIASEAVRTVADWLDLGLTVLFQLSLLYAIRMLSDSIELKKLSRAALRNTLFVGIYAMLRLAQNLSIPEAARAYIILAANVFEILWIICVCFLLLSCMKNIGSEGEDEKAPSRSRIGWINRINDAYERTHDRLNEQARADGEEFMRRRREKKKKKGKK